MGGRTWGYVMFRGNKPFFGVTEKRRGRKEERGGRERREKKVCRLYTQPSNVYPGEIVTLIEWVRG